MQIIVTSIIYGSVFLNLFNDGKQWGGRFVHGVGFYVGSWVDSCAGKENS